MTQLKLFHEIDPLHGFKSQEEYDENLDVWREVVEENEREWANEIQMWAILEKEREDEEEIDLQIWFQIEMENERERDEQFRQEMYEYMDLEFAKAKVEANSQANKNSKLSRGKNYGSGLVSGRRTGSKINVNPQVLSEKGNACKRQETL